MRKPKSHTAYAPLLGAITAADVACEPEADRLFIESGAYPKIVVTTRVQLQGHTFDVTFTDTSIGDVVAILHRRGCRPAAPAPAPAPLAAPVIDVPAPRIERRPVSAGAKHEELARLLLDAGASPSWEIALDKAKQHYTLQETRQ